MMSDLKKNKNYKNVEVVDNNDKPGTKKKYDDLKLRAADSIVNKMPEIVDTVRDIAEMYAKTDNQVKLIEAQGKEILREADAYVKEKKEEKEKIRAKGEVIINTLDKVNETLMSSNVPDEAKAAYAENLHKWITSIVEENKE